MRPILRKIGLVSAARRVSLLYLLLPLASLLTVAKLGSQVGQYGNLTLVQSSCCVLEIGPLSPINFGEKRALSGTRRPL